MSTKIARWIDEVEPINWNNFEDASLKAGDILNRLSSDKIALSQLTLFAQNDRHLRSLCECHALDDSIVIFDALEEKGFRVRWRLANSTEYERAHTHRFSFATKVLVGAHFETLYSTTSASEEDMTIDNLEIEVVKEIVIGQTFALHHQTIHSTTTKPGTIGLLLRGPAEKRCAVIVKRDSGTKWFHYGAIDESADRREEVAMSDNRFLHWLTVLRTEKLLA